MIWIPAVAAAVTAVAVRKWITSDDKPPKQRQQRTEYLTTLDQNLLRLHAMLGAPASAAFVGQPGAGKSSLVRTLTDGKCEPLPEIGVGTDATDWSQRADVGLVTRYTETVLIDAPGWGTHRHPVSSFVRHFPFERFDTLVLVMSGKVHAGDEEGFAAAARGAGRRIIVRTHCENLDTDERQSVANDLVSRLGPVPIMFVSNRTKEGVDALRDTLGLKIPDALPSVASACSRMGKRG